MDEQKQALYTLIYQLGLSEAEVANLTLTDVRLAGDDPSLLILDDNTGDYRSVALNEDVRNTLIAWMLARPDYPVPFLFPNDQNDNLTPETIRDLLVGYEPPAQQSIVEEPSSVSADIIAEEGLPEIQLPETTQVSSVRPMPSSASVPSDSPPSPPFRTAPPASGPERLNDDGVSSAIAAPPSQRPQPRMPLHPHRTHRRRQRWVERWLLIFVLLIVLLCGGTIAGVLYFPGRITGLVDGIEGYATARGYEAQFMAVRNSLETLLAQIPIIGQPTDPINGAADGNDGDNAIIVSVPTSLVNTATSEPPQPDQLVEVETPTDVPTDTPIVMITPTETVAPSETPVPTPTITTEPTATPLPTETPTPLPTEIPIPTNTSVPPPQAPVSTATPIPGFKYDAPTLISPDADFVFIKGNTIVLKWVPIGDLAPDERYAVRLVYRHADEVIYKGAQLRETEWTVPLELYHEADGPTFEYFWYVYVERVRADGIGIAISEESDHRFFTWD